METTLVSQYIDDELSIEEKIAFLEWLKEHPSHFAEALALLKQECVLSYVVPMFRPMVSFPTVKKSKSGGFWKRWVLGISLAAAIPLFLLWVRLPVEMNKKESAAMIFHRFVIYAPEVQRVEIAGTFSNWDPIPMKPSGNHGYWELMMPIEAGEYRYSILLDRTRRIADPTVPFQEMDDFGSANSILRIG